MDHILSAIMKGGGEALGEVIGLVIVALLMVACVLPIYFIMKKISGSKTTFSEDLQEFLTARPQRQSRPETLGLLSALDSAESSFLEIYKYLLMIALAAGTVFIVWFFMNVQNDAQRDFLRLYFGGGYLFLVFWVVGSFVMIKRRRARISGGQPGLPSINLQIPQATETILLNETSLQAARMWIAAGETIESVCGHISPEYKQWDGVKRQAFEMAVKGAAATGNSPAAMAQTASPPPQFHTRVSIALTPGVKTGPWKDDRSSASALTPQQIVLGVMVFLFAVGTFSFYLCSEACPFRQWGG
jgi:hypothetical protein